MSPGLRQEMRLEARQTDMEMRNKILCSEKEGSTEFSVREADDPLVIPAMDCEYFVTDTAAARWEAFCLNPTGSSARGTYRVCFSGKYI